MYSIFIRNLTTLCVTDALQYRKRDEKLDFFASLNLYRSLSYNTYRLPFLKPGPDFSPGGFRCFCCLFVLDSLDFDTDRPALLTGLNMSCGSSGNIWLMLEASSWEELKKKISVVEIDLVKGIAVEMSSANSLTSAFLRYNNKSRVWIMKN